MRRGSGVPLTARKFFKALPELLAMPNDANDDINIRKNADHIVDLFKARDFEMELLEIDGAPPLIYGALDVPGATRTIAIYVHYDGQPTQDTDWTHPPFEPTLYSRAITEGGAPIAFPQTGEAIDDEWRLYGRSAGDDKAPIAALLAALDALAAADIPLSSNIRLIF